MKNRLKQIQVYTLPEFSVHGDDWGWWLLGGHYAIDDMSIYIYIYVYNLVNTPVNIKISWSKPPMKKASSKGIAPKVPEVTWLLKQP